MKRKARDWRIQTVYIPGTMAGAWDRLIGYVEKERKAGRDVTISSVVNGLVAEKFGR